MRKRKFKTVTVAALAAMTLTGMNAVPCYAGITLPFIGEIGGSSVKEPELESMLGKSLKEMAGKFDGMSEPYWNMGMTSCSNGQVTLMSADSGDGGDSITQIQLTGRGNPYCLMGVDTGMSYSDATGKLGDEGLYQVWGRPVRFDENGNYVALSGEDHNLTVTMSHITLGNHTDKTDVSQYMGADMRSLFFEIDNVGARTEGEDTVVENDQVMFYARGQAVELGDLKVSKIVIRGNNSNYCMYGYQPGDSWESMYPGMQEGGSGEWTDPQGNVFSMYSSTDPSSPQIELLDPSFW